MKTAFIAGIIFQLLYPWEKWEESSGAPAPCNLHHYTIDHDAISVARESNNDAWLQGWDYEYEHTRMVHGIIIAEKGFCRDVIQWGKEAGILSQEK